MRLDVLEVVEEEPTDGQIPQVIEAGGGGAFASERLAEFVVVGVIRERDVGEKAAGFVLQFTQHAEVLHTIFERLDMPVEHRAVGPDAKLVRRAMHVDVVGPAELLVRDHVADGRTERLRAAAGHRVEAGFTQGDQHIGPAHLFDPRNVRDLHGGQGLDVHLRMPRLERAEHCLVVLEASLHIEAADDMELPGDGAIGPVGFGEHLLDAVTVRARFLR